MNKKFFTLIASAAMLVASLGTVNAAVPLAGTGGPAAKLPYGNSGNLYQLSAITVADEAVGAVPLSPLYRLAVSQNGQVYALDTTMTFNNFGESLWCVTISKENQGANPKFDFTNKSTGFMLQVSADDRWNVAGTDSIDLNYGIYAGWGFSKTYENALQTALPFSTYFTADSVYVLKSNGFDATTLRMGVGALALGANQLDPNDPMYFKTAYAGRPAACDSILLFTVTEPADLILNANEFNTKLGTQAAANVKLTFTPDRNNTKLENPWSDNALWATDTTVTGTTEPFVLFQKDKADWKTYLRVDTSYANSVGVKFLNFAYGEKTGSAIAGQYAFQVRYNVTNDSISIVAYEARYNLGTEQNWASSYATSYLNPDAFTPSSADSLFVKLQDLVVADQSRIITIGTRPVSTKATFGIGGCEPVGINLTSIDNNLYVIKKGEYTLVVPIYTDTVAPKWVKLDDATTNANYIPAYQWAVEKTRTDATYKDISAIKITNREFPHIAVASLQLREGENVGGLFGNSVQKTNFTAVPPAQKKDSILGYKYLTNEDSRFNTYVFNYLHGFDDTHFLNVKKIASDTSLYVDAAQTQFELIRNYRGEAQYGYWTKDIADLSKLRKVSYKVRVKDPNSLANSGKYVGINSTAARFVVNGYVAAADTALFLLKTNNVRTIDGVVTPYYALVDTTNLYTTDDGTRTRVTKVGIADETLWAFVQVQKETRTSTFSIYQYNEPLYRRFDGGTYSYNEIKEIYGTTANAPQWLKFTKQNNYNNEFLFENGPLGVGNNYPTTTENDYRQGITDKNISFLGLYNKSQFPERGSDFNYTFYVDTAYVMRSASGGQVDGYDSYTPKPQYMLAIRPEFVKGDTIYRIVKDSVWDSTGTTLLYETSDTILSFRPSFKRAFWVFNAQDSIGIDDNMNPHNGDYVGKFAYGAQYTTRLAFVDGVHMGDTFYVLRNKIQTSRIDSAYLLSIPAADKHFLGANTHYKPRWYRGTYGTGNYLPTVANMYADANNGKSMVFQFRLVDQDGSDDVSLAAARVRSFLIESRQDDGQEMGPSRGRWVKIQNGVPVISQDVNIVDALQNGAEIFNVTAGEENNAVANEATPSVTSLQVIGGEGFVKILNAAGKKVTVSNILGQSVAATVLSNDNVTLPLPKGIVVVAVDGEKAVKAIVK